jgi:hypothetical protein
MNEQEIVYTKALHKLFRAARRFRGQLEQFREEDIGSELWDAINAGSMITNAMSAAEIGNSMLLEELWKLGAVRREKLTKQDSALYGKLATDGWKVAFENIIVTGVVDSRVKSILVAYRPTSAMDETTVRTKAEEEESRSRRSIWCRVTGYARAGIRLAARTRHIHGATVDSSQKSSRFYRTTAETEEE